MMIESRDSWTCSGTDTCSEPPDGYFLVVKGRETVCRKMTESFELEEMRGTALKQEEETEECAREEVSL